MPSFKNSLVELVNYLKSRGIIPHKLAQLISTNKDINAEDDYGFTALFFAINKNHLVAIKKLLAAGAKNTLNHFSRTPFLHAIQFAHSKTIAFFLDRRNLPISFLPHDVLATDHVNRNALHIAAATPNFEGIQMLLKDRRFANCKNEKDLYGHTPFDLAVFAGKSDIAEALSGQSKANIVKLSHYGKFPLNSSQNPTNEQLLKFLSITGRQGELIITEGNCSGWVFLFLIYISLNGEPDVFNDLLTAITSWDGTQNGMLNNTLPSSLKREFPFSSAQALFNCYVNKQGAFKLLWEERERHPSLIFFFNQFKNPKELRDFLLVQHHRKTPLYKALCIDVFEKYNSMGDLLEEIVYQLCIFQFTSQAVKDLQLPGWDQDCRLQQYQLMQSAHSNRKLNLIFNFKDLYLNQAQLAEYLAFFAKRPNSFIDIGGARHATGLYITPKGKLYYFDPNFRHKVIPFDSPKALAAHMFKFMFRASGYVTEGKITITFDGYQFVAQNRVLMAPLISDFTSNANGFTRLHRAIMRHDLTLVDELLKADTSALYAKDSHHETPFRMAIRMQNGKCLQMIINAAKRAKLNLKQVAGNIDFDELRNLHLTFIYAMFMSNILMPDSIDEHQKTLLHSPTGYRSKALAKKVVNDPLWNPNKQDSVGATPLMYAVIYNQEVMLWLLEDPRIDVNLTDSENMTALMYALKNKSLYTNALLLKLKNKRSLHFNPNIADENGKTAVFYAVIYHADPSTLKYLLNCVGIKINIVDSEDKTPLLYALKQNVTFQLMQTLLLFQDLDVNKHNKAGLTPLMQGILFKTRTELLSLLIKDNRIQVNDTDQQGLTALMHALKNKADKQFILQLINHPNLNILIKDKAGNSALEYAANYPNKKIIHALREKTEQQGKQPLYDLTDSIVHLFSNISIREKVITQDSSKSLASVRLSKRKRNV